MNRDNLDDPLADLWSNAPAEPRPQTRAPETYTPPTYTEACKGCNGTGSWRGARGGQGRCFKCNGTGKKTFQTSPERRQANRQSAANRAVRRAEETRTQAEAWKAEHQAEMAWLTREAAKCETRPGAWTLPADLLRAVDGWGGLTENQLGVVRRAIAKDEARAQARAAAQADRPTVDAGGLTKIANYFAARKAAAAADGEGIKWLAIGLDTFVFSPAPDHGRNSGSIYVKENKVYLGKIVEGRFHRAHECNEDQERRILAALADAEASARRYGLQTGACGICGRELTNPISRQRGIGPICAARFSACWVN